MSNQTLVTPTGVIRTCGDASEESTWYSILSQIDSSHFDEYRAWNVTVHTELGNTKSIKRSSTTTRSSKPKT